MREPDARMEKPRFGELELTGSGAPFAREPRARARRARRETRARAERALRSALPLVLFDIADRLSDGRDLFRLVVRDAHPERFFELHNQLNDIQGVGPKVVDEAGLGGDLVLVDTEALADDRLHTLGYRGIRHVLYLRS